MERGRSWVVIRARHAVAHWGPECRRDEIPQVSEEASTVQHEEKKFCFYKVLGKLRTFTTATSCQSPFILRLIAGQHVLGCVIKRSSISFHRRGCRTSHISGAFSFFWRILFGGRPETFCILQSAQLPGSRPGILLKGGLIWLFVLGL